MEKTEIKLDIKEKDIALVCLAIENEELKRKLDADVRVFSKLKNKNTLLTLVAGVSLYTAFVTYRELQKARFIISQSELYEKKNTDEK